MKHNHPLISCLEPRFIKNPYTGEQMLTGCGKCIACLRSKSAMLTNKVMIESRKHVYKHFITLTYDPKYLPIMKAVHVGGTKGHCHMFVSLCERLKEDGLILNETNYTHVQCKQLAEKCQIGELEYGYGSLREIQLFLKRLRKLIHKTSKIVNIKNEKIRYFACMEYGPKTFRPHYHLILWLDDRYLSENLSLLVSESWKLGITDCQQIEHDCASYVAGYLNCTSDLPKIYSEGKCKPFCSHSFFLGEEFSKDDAEKVYQMSPAEFVKRSYPSDDSVSEYLLWRSAQARFYPKCRAFTTSSSNERKLLYTLYDAYRGRKETHRKPYQLAIEIIDHMLAKHTGYELQHFYKQEEKEVQLWNETINYYNMALLSNDIDPIICYKQIDESKQNILTILNRIYYDLRTSKEFLEFVCNSTHPVEIDTKLKMIESFYIHKDILQLNTQYETMYNMLHNEEISIDETKFFYDNFIDSKFENYLDSNLYKRHKAYIFTTSQAHKKHKLQNDANGFWLRQRNL